MRKFIFPSIALLTMLSTTLACATLAGKTPTPIAPPTRTTGPTDAPPTSTPLAPTVEASSTLVPPPPTDTPLPGAPTFTPIPTVAGTPVVLLSIRMFSETAGWGIGNLAGDPTDHILRTNDGGITWTRVTPPEPPGKRATGGFLDLQNAWVIYVERPPAASPTSTQVWRTTNGGANWTQNNLDVSGSEYFDPSEVMFVSAQVGWLLGHVGAGMNHDYVMGFATGDGGAHWTKVIDPVGAGSSDLYMSCTKTGLVFANVSTGWVTGDCNGVQSGPPYLQKTTDGGHAWAQQNLPAPAAAPNLFATDAQLACGTDHLAFTTPSNGALVVKCLDYSAHSALAEAWLYVTSDGGGTWTGRALPLPYGNLFFLNATTGWWLGSTTTEGTGLTAMYQTTDSGANWALLTNKLSWMGPVDFVTNQTGWVIAHAGSNTALVRSVNGGSKWGLIPAVVP